MKCAWFPLRWWTRGFRKVTGVCCQHSTHTPSRLGHLWLKHLGEEVAHCWRSQQATCTRPVLRTRAFEFMDAGARGDLTVGGLCLWPPKIKKSLLCFQGIYPYRQTFISNSCEFKRVKNRSNTTVDLWTTSVLPAPNIKQKHISTGGLQWNLQLTYLQDH